MSFFAWQNMHQARTLSASLLWVLGSVHVSGLESTWWTEGALLKSILARDPRARMALGDNKDANAQLDAAAAGAKRKRDTSGQQRV